MVEISSAMSCVVYDTCFAVRCCVQAPIIHRNFEISFRLDTCQNAMFYLFEKFSLYSVLDLSQMATWSTLQLQGVLKVE